MNSTKALGLDLMLLGAIPTIFTAAGALLAPFITGTGLQPYKLMVSTNNKPG